MKLLVFKVHRVLKKVKCICLTCANSFYFKHWKFDIKFFNDDQLGKNGHDLVDKIDYWTIVGLTDKMMRKNLYKCFILNNIYHLRSKNGFIIFTKTIKTYFQSSKTFNSDIIVDN